MANTTLHTGTPQRPTSDKRLWKSDVRFKNKACGFMLMLHLSITGGNVRLNPDKVRQAGLGMFSEGIKDVLIQAPLIPRTLYDQGSANIV